MFNQDKKIQFSELLSHTLFDEIEVLNMKPQSGGCINKAAILETNRATFFVKWNYNTLREMFDVEVKGLDLLRSTNEIKIPYIITLIDEHDESFLILEMISPKTNYDNFWEDFGVRLAKMHKHTTDKFGLDYDNYIGSLKQKNDWKSNWNEFFYENRLLYQLQMAFDSNKIDKSILLHFESLNKKLENIIPKEKPALLHGDLWGGNILKGEDGKVCLIDPAVYYGHREIELAYTMLFDNNPSEFYNSYENEFPLEKGFKERVEIYNLYPLLVHVNLFGGGYVNQVKRIIEKY